MRFYVLEQALKPMTGVLIGERKGGFETHRHRGGVQRESHMKTEAETNMMQLQGFGGM